MAQWMKVLGAMVADPRPVSYTYQEAATILTHLGFAEKGKGGSHRRWRLEVPDPSSPGGKRAVIIGMPDAGSGKLHHVYIRAMVKTLQANELLPNGL